ncbi:uncharacterized protein EV420DRAFT_1263295 [Desarmillaria tabescens]|uniref:Uncharacterized protein n=1 Tax=Armillaria tabescens TaxID=1929756 RepID=A0AA39NEP1_ARMTA|nr:uncharacterized protein EV420DRAFT_1263295 [Desarmillaria tabescens]KAK0464266.1 hypothetical protein EV420DRAFT_1263295 [Desarmillaria tabescens]
MAPLRLEQLLNPLPESPFCRSESSLAATRIEHNIQLNGRTTLKTLYHYPVDKVIQYPETSEEMGGGNIGHLFTMSSGKQVYNPLKDFAYSLGDPGSAGRKNVHIYLLQDDCGKPVPCQRVYRQGVKVCPYVPADHRDRRHTGASRHSLELQLQEERALAAEPTPGQDLFQKTLALWVAIRDGGCPHERQEDTFYSDAEQAWNTRRDITPTKACRRQHIAKKCHGRIEMRWSSNLGKPYIAYKCLLISFTYALPFHLYRCQHYSIHSKKHYVNHAISDGMYNLDYLAALCQADTAAINFWEQKVQQEGFGPLVPCSHVRNHSSIKVNCHGTMFMTEMINVLCDSKITAYIPLPEYWEVCPKVLVVCCSPHTHPIPLPATTPDPLKCQLTQMLQDMGPDLPDLTPRCLLRHPLFRSFLRKSLPDFPHPMATDLHPSLANLDHLASLINTSVKRQFPEGTGLQGKTLTPPS